MTPAGRYYHVSPRFWRVTRDWSEDARTLAMYLATAPHRNMVALYYCPIAYMGTDLGWDHGRTATALEDLISRGYAYYDHQAEVVFVPQALREDPPTAGKQTVGAVAALRELPTTPLLETLAGVAAEVCPELAGAVRSLIEGSSKTHGRVIEAASKPLPSSIEDPSIPEPDSRTRFPNPVPGTRDPEEREKPTPPPDMTQQERQILHALKAIEGYPVDVITDLKFVRGWLIRFPRLDLLAEIERCVTWWADKPKKGNWRLRVRNWLEKAESIRRECEARERAQGPGRTPGRYARQPPPGADSERARLRRLDIGIIRPDGSREEGLADPD